MLDYNTILTKIQESTSLSKEDIESRVNKKLSDLQDLISKEGAAQIVANELNVKVFDKVPSKANKVSEVAVGSTGIVLTLKVVAVYDTRSFVRNNKQGKVASLLAGDETGTIRLVVWDDNIISSLKEVKEGTILKVKNVYCKENRGFKELHLGNRGLLEINPEGETIGEIKLRASNPTEKKQIKDLITNDFAEVLGTIVQIFEPRYYQACPTCSKKVLGELDIFKCQEHGEVSAVEVPIVNLVLDDGTDNIRVVCFRQEAFKLVGESKVYETIKKDNLGKQLSLKGKVVKNDMFDRIEFVASSVEEVQPESILIEMEKI